jgi:bisphosphoglycerate-independent phosphoglycerate mutase (AlkP superfamily)
MNQLQSRAFFIDSARHDAFTFGLAMEYLKEIRPRLLYIALDETDDYAHDRKYAMVLESIRVFDRMLEELWTWIESTSPYRGATTLLITSDHGRGSNLSDWHGHGSKVEGAEKIWLAAIGPDTPATSLVSDGPTYYQRDVAPTALALLGIDPATYEGVAGKPIDAVLRGATR